MEGGDARGVSLGERPERPERSDIAADGFFSLGMIARFEQPLRTRGDWFYRRLFWECGLIGQVLYLEADATGSRATGIGCFYDDAVHDVFGFSGHDWQSLYHFSMGVPVEDTRLTTRRRCLVRHPNRNIPADRRHGPECRPGFDVDGVNARLDVVQRQRGAESVARAILLVRG